MCTGTVYALECAANVCLLASVLILDDNRGDGGVIDEASRVEAVARTLHLALRLQHLAKQRLRLAARHEALNAQAAKRWQRALDAALAGRATSSSLSPPPLRRRDEADALSDDEFEDPFPAGIESTAVPAY